MPKNDYVISLKKAYDDKPRKRRANYAVRIVYDFLKKHTRKERDKIVISEEVNNYIWSKSIQRPPRKVHVSLRNKDDFLYVFLKDSKNANNFGKEDPKKQTKKTKKENVTKESKTKTVENKKQEKKTEEKNEKKQEIPKQKDKETNDDSKDVSEKIEPVKEELKKSITETKDQEKENLEKKE
jgi:large subunit ribosomal protein L31e